MDYWRYSWIFIWVKFSLPEIFRKKQRHKGDFHLEHFLNSSCNLMCVCIGMYIYIFIYTQEHVGKSRNTCIKWKIKWNRSEPDIRQCLEAKLLLRVCVHNWAEWSSPVARERCYMVIRINSEKTTTKFLCSILARRWKYG